MVEKINVLVTGSGSLYGLAILQSLLKSQLPCRLVCCDSDSLTVGLHLVDTAYLVPPASAKKIWLDKMIDICSRERIAAVFIGSSHEVPLFADYQDQITEATGAKIFVHPYSVIKKCLDKWQTILFLKQHGFHYPRTLRWPEDSIKLGQFLKQVSLPVVAKPRFGAGSEGVAVLSERQQIRYFLADKKQYLLQEYLPDTDGEFTVGICVGAKGNVLSSVALRRTLRDGMTMAALSDRYGDICAYCERVAVSLGAYGPLNIQLRLRQQKPYIFEMNPRFSSSTGMRIALGVNEPELLLKSEIFGQSVTKPVVDQKLVLRQYADYVFPISKMKELKRI
jgi:carbamoyl-phosphate synthase large subunit